MPHIAEPIKYDVTPGSLITNLSIQPCYPNPFSPITRMEFGLPISTRVTIWAKRGRLPEEKETKSVSAAGGMFVSNNGTMIIPLLDREFAAGYYQFNVDMRTEEEKKFHLVFTVYI